MARVMRRKEVWTVFRAARGQRSHASWQGCCLPQSLRNPEVPRVPTELILENRPLLILDMLGRAQCTWYSFVDPTHMLRCPPQNASRMTTADGTAQTKTLCPCVRFPRATESRLRDGPLLLFSICSMTLSRVPGPLCSPLALTITGFVLTDDVAGSDYDPPGC